MADHDVIVENKKNLRYIFYLNKIDCISKYEHNSLNKI